MRVLVLGGTRFIGPRVVAMLAQRGDSVAVFHRGRSHTALPEGVERIFGDRTQLADARRPLRAFRPDVVVDMMAMTEGDAHALTLVFGESGARVVVASSQDVYRARDRLCRAQPGPPDPVPLDEDAPLRELLFPYRAMATGTADPKHDYDKILVERMVLGRLAATVLRLPAVYGPGDHQHRVYEYLKPMLQGHDSIPLDESLASWRWTRGFVDNVAHAIVLAACDPRATGRVYNVGEADEPTEREWVESIARAYGWRGRVVVARREDLSGPAAAEAAEHDFSQHWVTNTARIRRELGYGELVSREQAMARTVRWEAENPPREARAR
jgi:nucleoside-diphosphate-sugar epimerase